MKSLVTGAAGFIGSHLVQSLISNGASVRSFIKYGEDTSKIRNTGTEITQGDIREFQSVKKAADGVDIIYHLAAISRFDLRVPAVEYYETNILGTRNVLEAARLRGVRKVIYTSSIEAVGPSKDGKVLTEETEACPGNIYGKTKLGGEEAMREYHRKYGMHNIIVRIPMTYGPGDLVIFRRLFKIISKGYYPVVGDGKTLTEFSYVKNQVSGIKLAAQNGESGETYFISDERPYEIEEVINKIASALGRRVRIVHLPVSAAFAIGLTFEALSKVLRFHPFVIKETGRAPFSRKTVRWTSKNSLYCDCSKARRELGYRSRYSLSEGIRETISWYREKGLL